MNHLLSTEGLAFSYEDNRQVLKDVAVRLGRNEGIALLGANGSGKSTLLMNLNGSLRPAAGSIHLNGKAVADNRSGRELLSSNAALLFQDPDDQLFSSTVYEDISFGPSCANIERGEIERRVREALEIFDLVALQDRPVHHLSYGEKKRTALAGLFVMQTPLVLLDEPGSGLDPRSHDILLRALDTWRRRGSSIVIATHDLAFAFAWADTIILMQEGSVLAQMRKTDLLLNAPRLLSEARLTLPLSLRLELALARRRNSSLTITVPDSLSLEELVRMLEDA